MKSKLLQVRKMLLVAAGLLVGASSVCAQSITLYEKTAETWTETDLDDWASNASTASISGGLKQTNQNGDFSATKSFDIKEHSKVTLTATITGGGASGRSGSYDYITIGGVSLRLYGQDQKASIVIDDKENSLSSYKRNGAYNLSVTIDQASGNVSYSVSGDATGVGTGTTNKPVENVVVGHTKAGGENYEISVILSSIKVEEEEQVVETATYTIQYQFGGETIKEETGSTVVGNTVDAVLPITVDGQKYYAADNATTSIVIGKGSNTLVVDLRKAYEYSYTIKTSLGETIATGVSIEDEQIYVAYAKYLNVEGVLYEAAQGNSGYYKLSVIPDKDNYTYTITYSPTTKTNVVYFSEGEDIEGMTKDTGSNADIRCSMGAGGYSTDAVKATTLQPGKYMLTANVWGNSGSTIVIKAGEATVLSIETKGYIIESTTSEAFEVKEATDITIEGTASGKPLDYMYIAKVAETTTIASSGYSTLASACGLDFSDVDGLTAYVVTEITSDAVKLEKVNEVPANTGVILKGTGDTSYSIPVKADATFSGKNLLKAAVTATAVEANEAYILKDGEFHLVTTASEVPAGKAYLEATAGARTLSFLFGGETTGIAEIEKAGAENGAIYNLSGQRISKPANGLYIMNGKKVIIK